MLSLTILTHGRNNFHIDRDNLKLYISVFICKPSDANRPDKQAMRLAPNSVLDGARKQAHTIFGTTSKPPPNTARPKRKCLTNFLYSCVLCSRKVCSRFAAI